VENMKSERRNKRKHRKLEISDRLDLIELEQYKEAMKLARRYRFQYLFLTKFYFPKIGHEGDIIP
jgi:hypothetical protein